VRERARASGNAVSEKQHTRRLCSSLAKEFSLFMGVFVHRLLRSRSFSALPLVLARFLSLIVFLFLGLVIRTAE
jgi:hypothetical protein